MKTLDIDKATLSLANYAMKTINDSILITKNGKPLAALVGIHNADMETITLSNHPDFLGLIAKSRTHHKINGGISHEEMLSRLNNKSR
jgi:hypothetical protein